MEQYESEEGNIQEIVMDIVLKVFDVMNLKDRNLGSVCPQKLVDEYNRNTDINTNKRV